MRSTFFLNARGLHFFPLFVYLCALGAFFCCQTQLNRELCAHCESVLAVGWGTDSLLSFFFPCSVHRGVSKRVTMQGWPPPYSRTQVGIQVRHGKERGWQSTRGKGIVRVCMCARARVIRGVSQHAPFVCRVLVWGHSRHCQLPWHSPPACARRDPPPLPCPTLFFVWSTKSTAKRRFESGDPTRHNGRRMSGILLFTGDVQTQILKIAQQTAKNNL